MSNHDDVRTEDGRQDVEVVRPSRLGRLVRSMRVQV